MTIDQIKNVGIAVDKWDTLEGVCTSMLFSNEGYISPSQKTVQFYIDSNNEIIFLRYTRGDLHDENSYGRILVNIKEGNNILQKYTTLSRGGVKDPIIGIYHDCYDINEITSIR